MADLTAVAAKLNELITDEANAANLKNGAEGYIDGIQSEA
jgi:hypothetical protein